MDSTTGPACQKWGEGPHTMEYWLLDCPALSKTRLEIFDIMTSTLTFSLHLHRQLLHWQDIHSSIESVLACVPLTTAAAVAVVPQIKF